MRMNPHVYGIDYSEVEQEPTLETKRRQLIHTAAMALDKAKMILYNESHCKSLLHKIRHRGDF
jgi:activating signal cointegrator complex subunit 3